MSSEAAGLMNLYSLFNRCVEMFQKLVGECRICQQQHTSGLHHRNKNDTYEVFKLIFWSTATLSLRLMHLNLVWQQLTAAVHMAQHLLLQLGHLIPEQVGRRRQVAVLVLQCFHLVLQPGDSLQFASPTLGSRDPVPEPLPLGFNALLGVHVDGGQRGTLPEALNVGDSLRFLFQRRHRRELRLQVMRREGSRVCGIVHAGSQWYSTVIVQVCVNR